MINDREDSYFYLQVYYVTSEFLATKGIFMDSIHKVVKKVPRIIVVATVIV